MEDPRAYGRAWAEDYDELHAGLDPTPAVEAVAGLAGQAGVLELGVGTGRVALPLAERGVDVVGVEASPEMIAKLREKPGGDAVRVVQGDFAEATLDRTFGVVLLAFNTLFALPTQEAQVACFRNAARHLGRGGAFVLEAFVPDLDRFHQGQRVACEQAGGHEVVLECSRHDPVIQRVDSTTVRLAADGPRTYPASVRYAWPAELDLMGRLAGLELAGRWGGWRGEPSTAASGGHVSVYRPVGRG